MELQEEKLVELAYTFNAAEEDQTNASEDTENDAETSEEGEGETAESSENEGKKSGGGGTSEGGETIGDSVVY